MCIIVDANRLSTFANLNDPNAEPIHRWLRRGATIVYSVEGAFANEISYKAKRLLQDYDRAGIARNFPAQSFVEELRKVQRLELRSDDPHVLALARASGARLLYSNDRNLHDDFRDTQIVPRPKGKVYSSARNKDLLNRSVCRS